MGLARFAVNNPILINLVFIFFVVAGLFAYFTMPRSAFPDLSINEAVVVTIYPGAAPAEVEKLVTKPIEEELEELEDLEHVSSRSAEGRSVIELFYEDELGREEMDDAVSDLMRQVTQVTGLPADAEDPIVIEIDSETIVPLMMITVGGPLGPRALRQVALDLREAILDAEGVSEVTLLGEREREVWVEADGYRLTEQGLALGDLVGALGGRNVSMPAGNTNLGRSRFVVRTEGEFDSVEEIRRTVVAGAAWGGEIRVGDVAAVIDTVEEEDVFSRLDGEVGITMVVSRKSRTNVSTVARNVRQAVAEFQEGLRVPTSISIRNDAAEVVEELLGVLKGNGGLGAVMVGLALYLVLGTRNAILAIIGIPFSFLCTFLLLSLAGMSVNMLTLFSLVLVLGMVVDDAIIIIENTYRHLERGVSARMAAIVGTGEIIWPVVAAVSTTVAAFVPMLLMTGMMGKFMEAIPKTVAFALVASLFEALFILPGHLGEFSRPLRRPPPAVFLFRRLIRIHRRILIGVLRRRYYTLAAAVAGAIGCILLMGTLDVVLFHDEDYDQIIVHLRMAPGTRLSETDRVVRELEERVWELPRDEVKALVTNTGHMIENYRSTQESNLAEITVELTPWRGRDRSDVEIMADLRQRTEGMAGPAYLHFSRPQSGPPTGAPVEIRVAGDDLATLRELAGVVRGELAGIPGAVDIGDDYELGKRELRVRVDEDAAALVGVSVWDVASSVRTAFEGAVATTYRDGDDELDVVVRLREDQRRGPSDIRRLHVRSRRGELVPVGVVAEVVHERGLTQIFRRDGDRVVTVTADVDPAVTSSYAVNRAIQERLVDFSSRYPGYSLDYGGEFQRTQESFSSLYRAFVVAILLIFTILAAQFRSLVQPVVVLFTVPLAFMGVVIGLAVMGMPFTLNALVAIVALAGLVVNGSLVLVDFVNRARRQGMGRYRSIVTAGAVRLRPVLLTAITTILGLLPMALGLAGTSEAWGPMATSLVWGLGFSSILTLVVIPAVLAVTDDILLYFKRPLVPRESIRAGDSPECLEVR